MTFELDNYDRKLVALLQQDGRMPYAEIGRHVHLSAPAIAERIRRLEEEGVLNGFTARVNLRALGYGFETFINITVDSHDALDRWAATRPEVLELHATTGNHCALLRIALRDPSHLEALLKSLGEIGKTSTSMILSSQFEARPRVPADQTGMPVKRGSLTTA